MRRTAAALLLAASCATSATPPAAAPAAPEWVELGSGVYTREGVLSYVAVGSTFVRTAQLRDAAAIGAARSEMAKIFETAVASAFKTFCSSDPDGDEVRMKHAAEVARRTLPTAELGRRWEHPDGRLFMEVHLPVAAWEEALDVADAREHAGMIYMYRRSVEDLCAEGRPCAPLREWLAEARAAWEAARNTTPKPDRPVVAARGCL